MSTKPFADIAEQYTRVHNYVLDVIMPREHKSTLCVLLAAIRCTVGWQKESDRISLTQFERRTGMARNTVIRAIKTCLDKGYLLRFSDDAGSFYYTLNQDFEVEEVAEGSAIIAPLDEELARLSRQTSATIAPKVARLSRQTSATIAPEVARLSRTQKKQQRNRSKKQKDNNKQSDTSAKSEPPSSVDVVVPSPQKILLEEFGIAITKKTKPLLEKKPEDIQKWINYTIAQGAKISNPQGLVIAGLTSGYAPPENGGQNGATSKKNRDAAADREDAAIPADRHVVC